MPCHELILVFSKICILSIFLNNVHCSYHSLFFVKKLRQYLVKMLKDLSNFTRSLRYHIHYIACFFKFFFSFLDSLSLFSTMVLCNFSGYKTYSRGELWSMLMEMVQDFDLLNCICGYWFSSLMYEQ